jgi:hypothetical protein
VSIKTEQQDGSSTTVDIKGNLINIHTLNYDINFRNGDFFDAIFRDMSSQYGFCMSDDFKKISQNDVWNDLLNNGYIDKEGNITSKFKALKKSSEMTLSLENTSIKSQIFDILLNKFVVQNVDWTNSVTKTTEHNATWKFIKNYNDGTQEVIWFDKNGQEVYRIKETKNNKIYYENKIVVKIEIKNKKGNVIEVVDYKNKLIFSDIACTKQIGTLNIENCSEYGASYLITTTNNNGDIKKYWLNSNYEQMFSCIVKDKIANKYTRELASIDAKSKIVFYNIYVGEGADRRLLCVEGRDSKSGVLLFQDSPNDKHRTYFSLTNDGKSIAIKDLDLPEGTNIDPHIFTLLYVTDTKVFTDYAKEIYGIDLKFTNGDKAWTEDELLITKQTMATLLPLLSYHNVTTLNIERDGKPESSNIYTGGYSSADAGNGRIRMYDGAFKSIRGVKSWTMSVLTHESHHIIHQNYGGDIGNSMLEEYAKISNWQYVIKSSEFLYAGDTSSDAPVREYGRNAIWEDFATASEAYIEGTLYKISPNRYDFLKNKVYMGYDLPTIDIFEQLDILQSKPIATATATATELIISIITPLLVLLSTASSKARSEEIINSIKNYFKKYQDLKEQLDARKADEIIELPKKEYFVSVDGLSIEEFNKVVSNIAQIKTVSQRIYFIGSLNYSKGGNFKTVLDSIKELKKRLDTRGGKVFWVVGKEEMSYVQVQGASLLAVPVKSGDNISDNFAQLKDLGIVGILAPTLSGDFVCAHGIIDAGAQLVDAQKNINSENLENLKKYAKKFPFNISPEIMAGISTTEEGMQICEFFKKNSEALFQTIEDKKIIISPPKIDLKTMNPVYLASRRIALNIIQMSKVLPIDQFGKVLGGVYNFVNSLNKENVQDIQINIKLLKNTMSAV